MDKIEVKKIKVDYGEAKLFRTEEASFGIETLLPKKRTPTFYLERNRNYLIILEGTATTPTRELHPGEIHIVPPGEHFWIENKTKEIVRYIFIDIPPVEEGDLVWVK